jgi:hypothetical protein
MRGDRSWMDAHLADDFTEFGYSGRSYSRAETLDLPVGPIEATLIIGPRSSPYLSPARTADTDR